MSVDVISIGAATLDILMRSKSFVPHTIDGAALLCEIYGGKADVEEATITTGGAATNTAVSFVRQGLRAAVLAEVGQDPSAQLIYDELAREKVETELLVEEHDEHTALSVVLVAPDASRSVLTYRGAAHMLTSKDIAWDQLKQSGWIHLSGVGNADLVREIFLFVKEHSLNLSWNPSRSDLEEVVLRSGQAFSGVARFICLNDQEYAAIEQRHDLLIAMTQTLIITKGKTGGEVWRQRERFTYASKAAQAVCEVGAGDAFIAGVVGATIRGLSLMQAIEFGAKNSASVVEHLGAKKGLLRVG